jgi:Leucine-rich repeat (LRR) protein
MNVKIISLQSLIIVSLTYGHYCHAHDVHEHEKQEYTHEQQFDPFLREGEPQVTLESGEKERPEIYKVPESIAFQSSVIKNSIIRAEDVGEAVRYIKFDDVSGGNLKIFIDAMQVMRDSHDKDPNITVNQLAHEIEKNVTFPDEVSLPRLKEMINQAAYLQLKPLIIVIARFIATALHGGQMNNEDLATDISQQLIAEVARQYYLFFNELLEGVTVPYGVSIRELLVLNRLPTIPEYLEYDLSGFMINDLNGLQEIPDIGKVKTLNLSDNALQAVKSDDFVGLGNLESLNLSYNRLTHLMSKTFKGLGSLVSLNISHNFIHTLETDTFNGLGSLKKLDLSFNNLSKLVEQLFAGMGNLESLNLSVNHLVSLSYKSFKDMVSLKELNLQDNLLKKLVASGFAQLSSLITLKISYNELEDVSPKAFEGLKSLKVLDLGTNRIAQFPRELFQGLKNLTSLYASHNALSSLDVFVFKDHESLVELDLSHNLLEAHTFESGILTGPKNLEVLRLNFNALDRIPEEVFTTLKKLRKLYVIGNQISSQSLARLSYKWKKVNIIFWQAPVGHMQH